MLIDSVGDNFDKPGFEFDDSPDIQYPTNLNIIENNQDLGLVADFKPKPLVFAKCAKRVDVQKLKSNLWSKITETTTAIAESHKQEDKDNQFETKFSNIVGELSTCYEEKSRKDISVAFCFICVLHLANENNLDILEEAKDLVIIR